MPKEDKPLAPPINAPGGERAAASGDLPGEEWLGWAACVATLGGDDFAARLLATIGRVVAADHLSFFRLVPGTPPSLVAAETGLGGDVAAVAGQQYVKSLYYRFDPNTRRIGHGGQIGDGDGTDDGTAAGPVDGPLVTRLLAADIADPAYKAEIYERFALEDRLSIMGHEGAVWHIVSLYRDRSTGRFSAADEAALGARAPLISQLAARQLATLPQEAWAAPTLPPVPLLETMVRDLGARLSDREVQVCARALLGKTGEGIALDLNVKETTIATLRKRAYAKLGISTLNELFALCLSREAGARPIGVQPLHDGGTRAV